MSYWPIWLLAIVISFVVLETLSFKTGHPTLSRWTWDLFLKFPLVAVLYGGVFIGLAVHFFWHWCPPGSGSVG